MESRKKQDSRYWKSEYESWQKSGMTQMKYCAKTGLKFWEFKDGIKTLKSEGILPKTRGRQAQGRFLPMKLESEVEATVPYCEIRFEGGHGIQIESKESLFRLKQMVQDLMQR